MLKYVTCLFLVIGVPTAAKTLIHSGTIAPGVAYHDVSDTWHGTEAGPSGLRCLLKPSGNKPCI
ncbi:hypothetical protein [Acidocella sp.]|jgi:hypothetical protein|uniref:hypothetical protein n=1 Tax=Acidocella sp. TaxID=50710 RepID=UPI002F3E8729